MKNKVVVTIERHFIGVTLVCALFSPPWSLSFGQDQQSTQQQIAQLQTQQQLLSLQVQLLQSQAGLLAAQRGLGSDAQRTADIAQQTALINALAALQKAQGDLAKGNVEADTAMANAQKALQDAQNQLLASQLKSDFVQADVLKAYLPEAKGKEGAITIKTDGTRLLQTSVASANATYKLAEKFCDQLHKAGVRNAVVMDVSKLAAIQEAFLIAESFDDMKRRVQESQDAVEKELTKLPAGPAALPAAAVLLAELPYIAGGIEAIIKLFRTDRDLLVGSDNTRADLFATFIGTTTGCKDVVENAFPDYLALDIKDKLNELRRRYQDLFIVNANAADVVLRAENEIKRTEEEIEKLRAALAASKPAGGTEPKPKPTEQDITTRRSKVLELRRVLGTLKANLEASKGLVDSVKAGPENKVLLYAGLMSIGSRVEKNPRLIYTFTSQEIQETKTSVWSSARQARLGTAHVSYRVLNADNKRLLTGGFLSHSTSESEMDLEKEDEGQLPPIGKSQAGAASTK